MPEPRISLDDSAQRLEGLLVLIKDVSAILGDRWDNIPQEEIKRRINHAIAHSLNIAI